MNTDIRKYIRNNFKDSDIQEIESTIDESVKSNDEIVLPGLGVFFEMTWKNESLHKQILDTIYNEIKKSH